jgi:hypothetical protein
VQHKCRKAETDKEHGENTQLYLQTSPEHFRCHIIYTKGTQSKRNTDTVFFKTKFITQPTLTPIDTIVNAFTNLTNALKGTRKVKGIQDIKQLNCYTNFSTTYLRN